MISPLLFICIILLAAPVPFGSPLPTPAGSLAILDLHVSPTGNSTSNCTVSDPCALNQLSNYAHEDHMRIAFAPGLYRFFLAPSVILEQLLSYKQSITLTSSDAETTIFQFAEPAQSFKPSYMPSFLIKGSDSVTITNIGFEYPAYTNECAAIHSMKLSRPDFLSLVVQPWRCLILILHKLG